MKNFKKIALFLIALTLAFTVTAREDVEDVTLVEKLCSSMPALCIFNTRGGHGGGTEPPKPPKRD